jgi:hypothetical protein
VLTAANGLSKQAEQLTTEVTRFVTGIRRPSSLSELVWDVWWERSRVAALRFATDERIAGFALETVAVAKMTVAALTAGRD